MNLNDYPTPRTDKHEKSPFQHACGMPPPGYLSVESEIVRGIEREAAAWRAVAYAYRLHASESELAKCDEAFDRLLAETNKTDEH